MLFKRLFCDRAPLTPFSPDAVIQRARPTQELPLGLPGNPVPMIRCSRVSGFAGFSALRNGKLPDQRGGGSLDRVGD